MNFLNFLIFWHIFLGYVQILHIFCHILSYCAYDKGYVHTERGVVHTAKRVHIFCIFCILFNIFGIFQSNLHILYILHIFYLTILLINSYPFLTGFYLSDNAEEMPEDPTATANDEQLPDSDAHFLLADDTKEIAADQPPGLGVHLPAWNLRRGFSAPNR